MKRFLNLLLKIETSFIIFCLITICIIILSAIFCRYALNSPIGWSEELSLLLLHWMTFIGVAVLYKREELVKIGDIFILFPPKVRYVLKNIFFLLTGGLCLFVVISIINLYPLQTTYTSVALRIPRWYYMLPAAIGFASIFIFVFSNLFEEIQRLFGRRSQ